MFRSGLVLAGLLLMLSASAAASVDLSVTGLAPAAVVQTEPVPFDVTLENAGDGVVLDTLTTIEFTDGGETYSAALLDGAEIPAGGSATLTFELQPVPATMLAGTYVPTLTCHGLADGQEFTEILTPADHPIEVHANATDLMEESGAFRPLFPSSAYCYPCLVWLTNTAAVSIELDQRSRLALTDGTRLYGTQELAMNQTLLPGTTTKLEFALDSFPNAPAGQYDLVLTLLGPTYAQALTLTQTPVNVLDDTCSSFGAGPSTANFILAIDEQTSITFVFSSSCGIDRMLWVGTTLEDGYPDAPVPGTCATPVFCDLDGDADFDLLLGGEWGNLTLVENCGTADTPAWAPATPAYASMRVGPRSKPALVDIDADEDPDLFVGDADGGVWFYRNLGTPAWPTWYGVPRGYPPLDVGAEAAPTFGDIDADDDFDLLVGCSVGTVWQFINLGTAALPDWSAGTTLPGLDVGGLSFPTLGDLDGDGDLDLLCGGGDGTLTFVENIGTPTAPQWATPVPGYAGIDVGEEAAPTLADIDADLDLDLLIGRASADGLSFYRNVGSSTAPAWSEESFAPTYMRPARYPEVLTWDPLDDALLTDPTLSYIHDQRIDFEVFVAATEDVLANVVYEYELYPKTFTYASGGGIHFGAAVILPITVIFDDECEAIVADVSPATAAVQRTTPLAVEVTVTNSKVYELGVDITPDATTLLCRQGETDVSDRFAVALTETPGVIPPGGQETLHFELTPLGDAPLGAVLVDPLVTTRGASSHSAANYGSSEWPVPTLLTLDVQPRCRIVSDTEAVVVPECATATFGLRLSDQPPGELVVSVVHAGGDPDISVASGATLTFTPDDWDTDQAVTLAAAEDPDEDDGSALIRCSAPGWTEADVEAVEFDHPCHLYVNDDIPEEGIPAGDDGNDGQSPQAPMRHIQALLDAYPDVGIGTVVHVSIGTYVENVSIGASHSGLTIEGAGADQTILDGNQAGRCLTLSAFAEGHISGMTLRNGSSDRGSGVYCEAGSGPVIRDCAIVDNWRNLDSSGGAGGIGVYCHQSSPTITNCTVSGNTQINPNSQTDGGGILIRYGSFPTITHCVIAGNAVRDHGGGIYIDWSGATIRDCIISDNTCSRGGGFYIDDDDGQTTVVNCTIAGNHAGNEGGGTYCYRCAPTFGNCLLTGNSAGRGGAIYCFVQGAPILSNATITGNSAVFGGGVDVVYSGSPSLSNCILWDDSATYGPEISLRGSSNPGQATLQYCDVAGGQAAAYVEDGCSLIWGAGNIDEDPLFVDADGPDDDPATWDDNDHRLLAGSPCIDAGDNTAVPADVCDLDEDGDVEEPLPLDLDDNPRFHDDVGTADTGNPDGVHPIVDLGAYEFQGTTVRPGDLDGDGDVDMGDFELFVRCMAGADNTPPPGCDPLVFENADLDGDGDIDLADFAVFQQVFTGQ